MRRLTIEEVHNRFSKLYNGQFSLQTENFKNNKSKCLIKCNKCQNTFTMALNMFFNPKKFDGCPCCRISHRGYREPPETYLEDSLNEASDGSEYEWIDIEFKGSRIKHKIKHKTCGHIYEVRPYYFRHNDQIRCPYCSRKKSKIEIEFGNQLLIHFPNIIFSDRSQINPYELDYFDSSNQFAVELNGLFWHSDKFKEPNYHKNKLDLCLSKNIKLFQFFENEIKQNSNAVINKIKENLNLLESIPVSSEEIIEISPEFAHKFEIENSFENHNYSKSSKNYGLFTDKICYQIISLNIDINSCKIQSIITKLNFNPDNFFEKFLEFLKLNFNKIYGSINLRYDFLHSNLFSKFGFEMIKISEPSFYFTDDSDITIKKQDLKIYDCGSVLFKLNFQTSI